MELDKTGPEMAAILQEMGVKYNPRRLANALRGRNVEISTRAIRITYTLGKFILALAQVCGVLTLPESSSSSSCTSTSLPIEAAEAAASVTCLPLLTAADRLQIHNRSRIDDISRKNYLMLG